MWNNPFMWALWEAGGYVCRVCKRNSVSPRMHAIAVCAKEYAGARNVCTQMVFQKAAS